VIFKRKKPASGAGGGQPVLRGRDSVENEREKSSSRGDNPLARRFHPQDEPDTVDLDQPPRFHADDEQIEAESATRDLGNEPDTQDNGDLAPVPGSLSVITYVAETDKFYLQPGEGDTHTLLAGKPVTAPTELRHGDCVQIGKTELHFLPVGDRSTTD